ncbi:MAG: hypothetical protein DME04_19000 [Candidatus Rokuibacteriota bacterium]|nr:MAG: hypothetical protein DME04_19000 [Candidatus Rokubacteria bacterium]
MIALRRALLVVLAAVLVTVVAPAPAQQIPAGFRVTYNVDKTGPTHVELSGQVYNDNNVDVTDVYVSAEAVDSSGKVVAQGIPYVGSVRSRSSAPFKARVPVVPNATAFRVGINGFRFALGRESP